MPTLRRMASLECQIRPAVRADGDVWRGRQIARAFETVAATSSDRGPADKAVREAGAAAHQVKSAADDLARQSNALTGEVEKFLFKVRAMEVRAK